MEAGINYTFVLTLQAALMLARPGTAFTAAQLFGVYVGVTAVHAVINMVRGRGGGACGGATGGGAG